MLAALLNVPQNDRDWNIWSWHHRLSHDAIIQAVGKQKKIGLTSYVIDPIPLDNLEDWLERNQLMHLDMDQATGAQSADLSDVDPQDKAQLQAWIQIHYLDHQTVERRLNIGT